MGKRLEKLKMKGNGYSTFGYKYNSKKYFKKKRNK
jgi:hypothetical protein